MVTIHDLTLLFTGEPDPAGGWLTRPHPTVALATAICDACACPSLLEVLHVVYGPGYNLAELDQDAVDMLEQGYRQWWRTGRRTKIAA